MVPYYLDCYNALQAEPGGEEVLAVVQRAVQQCESTQAYQCTCTTEYNGDNCEESPKPEPEPQLEPEPEPKPEPEPEPEPEPSLPCCTSFTYASIQYDEHCSTPVYCYCPEFGPVITSSRCNGVFSGHCLGEVHFPDYAAANTWCMTITCDFHCPGWSDGLCNMAC